MNAEICRQCYQFAVALPSAKTTLDNLALPKRPPWLRFRTIYVGDDEILRVYTE